MQIAPIATSLKALATANPMAAALVTAGLSGSLHYGTRASRSASRPFATFSVNETEREYNSSGVALVTYEVSVAVYVDYSGEIAAAILDVFQRYWGGLADLPGLDDDLAEFVLIHPETSEIGETEQEDMGVDIILGIATWTLRIAEHQPEIVEE